MIRLAALAVLMGLPFCSASLAAPAGADPIIDLITRLEDRLDARIGITIQDLENGREWSHRADERFPMASTFKVLACAALLDNQELLARPVEIKKADLLSYSPVTETLAGQSVTGGELCAATMRTSDNTAANKVLELLDGPEGVTRFLRSIGDQTTRLDRWEPDLNAGEPGSPLDTTTPAAMAKTLRSLVLGNALAPVEKDQLTTWLVSNQVGGPLLRAGISSDWHIADRTGAGGNGTRGVVAVMWPPQRKPVVAAIYLTQTTAAMDERNAAIAEIGAQLAAIVSADR